MKNKKQLITLLNQEFDQWEELLAGLSEEQINTALKNSNWTTKDVVAHLMAWQQISNARLNAALSGVDPQFPVWLAGCDPDSDDDLEKINDGISQIYHDSSWKNVYQIWKAGFQKLLQLTEMLPEQELLEPGKFTWLNDNPLSAVLLGTYEHHHEHREPLLAYFYKSGK